MEGWRKRQKRKKKKVLCCIVSSNVIVPTVVSASAVQSLAVIEKLICYLLPLATAVHHFLYHIPHNFLHGQKPQSIASP